MSKRLALTDGLVTGAAAIAFLAIRWPYDLLVVLPLAGWILVVPHARTSRLVRAFVLTAALVAAAAFLLSAN